MFHYDPSLYFSLYSFIPIYFFDSVLTLMSYPGLSLGASVSGYDFKKDHDLMMELANRAIEEYNERECNVFKYKVIKIEKVNLAVTDYFDYWMTVRVLNLTLATPIETFQIHAGKKCLDGDVKFICCCQPKEEPVVGLGNCDFCLRKKLPLET